MCSDLIVDVVRVVSGDTNKVDGGFRLVLELPPRFPDATEARRRVSKLVSIVGSFTAGTYDEHEGGKKVASIAIGAPGAKGAAKALAAREDWEVTTNPNAPLCSLQWAPHRTVCWERVMEESPATRLVASHHYARAGLLRRVELSRLLHLRSDWFDAGDIDADQEGCQPLQVRMRQLRSKRLREELAGGV